MILLREQVNDFYQVRVMRWKGGWAARVPTPSLYASATLAPRNPINSWQAAPWRRGACGYRVLIKLLRFATRQRAVLGATFLDFDDSFGHLQPTGRLERGCACERVNVHMCEARAPERCFRAYGLRSAFRKSS